MTWAATRSSATGRYGTTLVMRGTDEAGLEAMLDAVTHMIVELGGEALDIQKG